jgi:hypothetical protein
MSLEIMNQNQSQIAGSKPPASISDQIKEMDRLYSSMELGAASETVLRAIDPIIEKRLGVLLDQLAMAPAELGPILDIRAKICETWRMRKSLKEASSNGKRAVDTVKNLFSV